MDADARNRLDVVAGALAGASEAVELIETHMSWVLLTREHALKLKKPVRTAWFDYSSVDGRERDARLELALNRRLAPGVYLGLLALRSGPAGPALVDEAHAARDGRTLDWVLQMRRLPAARMLDNLIAAKQVSPHDIDRLGDLLFPFYREAQRSEMSAEAYVARFAAEQRLNRDTLLRPRFALQHARQALQEFDAALARLTPLLHARAEDGLLVDGHGDLRPEHVCLLEPPVIIDALEFSAKLRQVDPFDELSFLGLECELAGAPWIGPQLLARAARELEGAPPSPLPHFYAAARALLRARQSAAHLLDAQPRKPETWLPRASAYLTLCLRALDRSLNANPAGCA